MIVSAALGSQYNKSVIKKIVKMCKAEKIKAKVMPNKIMVSF